MDEITVGVAIAALTNKQSVTPRSSPLAKHYHWPTKKSAVITCASPCVIATARQLHNQIVVSDRKSSNNCACRFQAVVSLLALQLLTYRASNTPTSSTVIAEQSLR